MRPYSRCSESQLKTVLRNRPNKTAKGLTKTLYRSNHRLKDDALTLSVRGTLDTLARGLYTRGVPVATKTCPCCGTVFKKLGLSPHWKRTLERLRRKYPIRA
jgi:hypothetical protein